MDEFVEAPAAPPPAPLEEDFFAAAPAPVEAATESFEEAAPAPMPPSASQGSAMDEGIINSAPQSLPSDPDLFAAAPAPEPQAAEDDFFQAPPPAAAPLAAETFAVSENTAAWKAETAAAIADKSAAEKRELQSIQEEAQAERDLMYSQREKQLTAAHKANREREVQTQTDYKGQGWEGVNALISGESKTSSDLGRMRQIITRLKHNKPASSPSGMFST